MSETGSDLKAAEGRPLSPLQLFCAKVAIVTVAILVILFGAGQIIASVLEDQKEQLAVLKGGPVFLGEDRGQALQISRRAGPSAGKEAKDNQCAPQGIGEVQAIPGRDRR